MEAKPAFEVACSQKVEVDGNRDCDGCPLTNPAPIVPLKEASDESYECCGHDRGKKIIVHSVGLKPTSREMMDRSGRCTEAIPGYCLL